MKFKNYNNLINELIKRESVSKETFLDALEYLDSTFFENPELEMELLISNGLPLEEKDGEVFLKTVKNPIENQNFCIVDIETNGSNASIGQIIEIGAIKYRDGEIVDKYESLVYAKNIPENIQEVTKITPDMLQDAPPLKEVLEEFKIFLEDDIFVAHDIKFDYKFVSDSFEKNYLGKLENRKLCTIDLAKRTIEAQRYGLSYLRKSLDIPVKEHHRAYSDALTTSYIFRQSLSNLPATIKNVEALITFSKSGKLVNKK